MIEIVLATNNKNKLKEFNILFEGLNVKLHLMEEFNIVSNPIENGKSYKENALIKAREIKNQTDLYILADDSGIEIEELGEHFPGIESHRYAFNNGGNTKLNPILVKKYPFSKASFHSTIAFITPLKEEYIFEGIVNGKLNDKLEGTNGFGYDDIFIPENYDHTFAYYDEITKNKISHRAKATEKLIEFLKNNNLI